MEVKNLCKQFKTQEREAGLLKAAKALVSFKTKTVDAVKDINFEIERGELVGYIGPNGSGKSTTIKMLTGILVPTSGEINILGLCPYKDREENAKNIGVVFGQRTQLWWDLPVESSFHLLKHIYNIPNSTFNRNIKTFTKILEIDKLLKKSVRKLSLGERMRCDLAASLLHDPQILFLDEPTIGLDIVAKERIRKFLKEINKNKKVTIILTTHDMSDIEELCPRIIIIDKGRKIYDGPIQEIKKKFGKERVLIIDFHNVIQREKLRWKGVRCISKQGTRAELAIDITKVSLTDVTRRILSKWSIHDITIEEPEIEEIIRTIYREGLK